MHVSVVADHLRVVGEVGVVYLFNFLDAFSDEIIKDGDLTSVIKVLDVLRTVIASFTVVIHLLNRSEFVPFSLAVPHYFACCQILFAFFDFVHLLLNEVFIAGARLVRIFVWVSSGVLQSRFQSFEGFGKLLLHEARFFLLISESIFF